MRRFSQWAAIHNAVFAVIKPTLLYSWRWQRKEVRCVILNRRAQYSQRNANILYKAALLDHRLYNKSINQGSSPPGEGSRTVRAAVLPIPCVQLHVAVARALVLEQARAELAAERHLV